MTQEEFNVVFELQMRKCADILAHKKKEYTGDNIDRLSAFKIAAALQNCDPKAALAGMMSKHVVSLYDIISRLVQSGSDVTFLNCTGVRLCGQSRSIGNTCDSRINFVQKLRIIFFKSLLNKTFGSEQTR